MQMQHHIRCGGSARELGRGRGGVAGHVGGGWRSGALLMLFMIRHICVVAEYEAAPADVEGPVEGRQQRIRVLTKVGIALAVGAKL